MGEIKHYAIDAASSRPSYGFCATNIHRGDKRKKEKAQGSHWTTKHIVSWEQPFSLFIYFIHLFPHRKVLPLPAVYVFDLFIIPYLYGNDVSCTTCATFFSLKKNMSQKCVCLYTPYNICIICSSQTAKMLSQISPYNEEDSLTQYKTIEKLTNNRETTGLFLNGKMTEMKESKIKRLIGFLYRSCKQELKKDKICPLKGLENRMWLTLIR